MADPEKDQSGMSDIQTPSQYPTASKIEDGIAYDISGKKLGPVSGMETAPSSLKFKFDPNAPIQALDNASPKPKFDPNAPIQALDQTEKPRFEGAAITFDPNAPIQPEEGWFHQNVVAPLADAARRVKNTVLANEGPGWLPYDILTKFGVKADPGIDWNKKVPMPLPATDAEAQAWIQEMSAKRSPQVNRDFPISLETAKKHIDEGRAVNRMEQVRSQQYSGGAEGETTLLSPERLFTPEEAEQHPILYGLMKMSGSLTSQENMLIMAGSGGLGFLGEAAATAPKLGAVGKLVAATPRLVSAYFAGQMAIGTAYQIPGLVKAKKDYDVAIKEGDQAKADQILWNAKEQAAEAAASAYMAYAAAYHAGTGHPDPVGKAVGDAVKETTRYAAQKGVEAFKNIPEVAKATAEGAKAAVGYTADKLGPMIGRTNDFATAMTRAMKITPKQSAALKDKVGDIAEDLQAIANANPNIEGPKDFAQKIREHNQAEEAKMQQAAGAKKDSVEPVVQNAEQRLRDGLDKLFDDNKGKFPAEDVEKAKQDILDHFLQRGDQTGIGPNGKPTYEKRTPNLFEAENIRQGLNDLTRPQYSTTAQPTTSAFKFGAMKAADLIRGMIDEGYHANGVEGVKEFRSKEAKKIDVADALEAAQDKADKMGNGSVWNSLMAKIGVPSTVVAIALGHPLSVPAVAAGVLGEKIRQNVSNPNVNVQRALDIAAKNPKAQATTVTENPQAPGAPPATIPPASPTPGGTPPVTPPPPPPTAPAGAPGMSAPTMFGGQPQVGGAQPTNHKLYAALSSHYSKIIGAVPFDALEERFMGDVQAAAEKGQPLTPEQARLLEKVNGAKAEQRANLEKQQKVDAIKAQKDAEKKAADQQKALEKEAAEAEKAAKEVEEQKKESGLTTNVDSPFEVGDDLELPANYVGKGYSGPRVRAHELGHLIMVDEAGHGVGDVISHLHDKIDKGALAEARWDKSQFQDENGKWDSAKLLKGLPDILSIFYGGPLAEEIVHGVPVDTNPGAGGDITRAKMILKKFGFSPTEIGMMTKAAEMKAREVLTTPGVSDIIQRYTSQREAGLDEGLHMHPETIGRAVQEVRQARGGGNGPSNKESSTGRAGKSGGEAKPGGEGKIPPANAEGARPAGEAGAGIGSEAGGERGVGKGEEPEIASHLDSAGSPSSVILKKGSKVVGHVKLEYINGIPHIEDAVIDDPLLRNKGYGTKMYKQVADLARKNGDETLSSNIYGMLSGSAKRVWESLIKSGEPIVKENTSEGPKYKWYLKAERGGIKTEIKDREVPKITDIIPELKEHPEAAQRLKDLGFETVLQREWMRQQGTKKAAPIEPAGERKVILPPERTTGVAEHDAAIKAGGGIPGGVTDLGEFGKIFNYHDPRTGSTLGFKEGKEITPETVKEQIRKSREAFGLKTESAAPDIHDLKMNLAMEPEQFKSWFGNSKIVDENGKPLTAYHGTTSPVDFDEFSTEGAPTNDEGNAIIGSSGDPNAYLGAHFAIGENAANVANKFAVNKEGWMRSRYEGESPKPRVISAYLKIENPVKFKSESGLNDFIYRTGKISDEDLLSAAMQSDGVDPDNDEMREEWYNRYDNDPDFRQEQNEWILRQSLDRLGYGDSEHNPLEDAAAELGQQAKAALKAKGHDGVLYKNEGEGGQAAVAFEPEQIKSGIQNKGTVEKVVK